MVEDGNPKFINSGSTSDEYNSTRKLLKEFALLDISTIENALRDSLNQPVSKQFISQQIHVYTDAIIQVSRVVGRKSSNIQPRLLGCRLDSRKLGRRNGR